MDENLKKQLDEQWEIERYNREKEREIERRMDRKDAIQDLKLVGMAMLCVLAFIGLMLDIGYLTIE